MTNNCSSSMTSSRTLTMAILLCAATSSHLAGVCAATSSRSRSCRYRSSPSSPSYAFAVPNRTRGCRRSASSFIAVRRGCPIEISTNEEMESTVRPVSGYQRFMEPDLSPTYTTTPKKGRGLVSIRRTGKQRSSSKRRRRVSTYLRIPTPYSSALHTSSNEQPQNRWHTPILPTRRSHKRNRRRSRTNNQTPNISSAAQSLCDDALLERIRNGQKSESPRWRKRTKRAAASFGFRLEEDDRTRLLHTLGAKRNGTAVILNDYSMVDDATTTTTRFPTTTKTNRKRKTPLTPAQYQTQKLLWAARYTSLPTLRRTFGTNRNKFWGDFDPSTTRRIYNTLLPRALLGLYEMGLWEANDLAPLAYEARITAKKYARERCVVPGRVVAMLYDGFRSWRDWGTWSVEGMTWEQVWYKYETQILEEMCVLDSSADMEEEEEGGEEEEVTAQICLRILERSCITNERINQLLLGGEGDGEEDQYKKPAKRRRRDAERYLVMIAAKLDMDMQELMEDNEQQFMVGATPTSPATATTSTLQ